MDDSKLKDRMIRFAREQYDMGMSRFEAYCDLPSGMINHIVKGISTVNLAKIAEKCPELNLRWMLLGEGEMLVDTKKEEIPENLNDCLAIIREQQQTIATLLKMNQNK